MPCEAPIHHPDCPCLRCKHPDNCNNCHQLTTDHFTPKSIARKVLGWTQSHTSSRENLQLLSKPCHREKDKYTGEIYNQALAQKKGVEIRFGEYIEYQKHR